jgi:hypothetical protein
MTLITGQVSLFDSLEDCAPVPEARSTDMEIARGVVAWFRWMGELVEEEERKAQAAEARRRRIVSKLRQVDLVPEEVGDPPRPSRVPANSDLCGQPATCRVLSCRWNTTLDLGEPERFEEFTLRTITLNTGKGDLGRRPAFNVEEQADAGNWHAFGEQVLERLDEMEADGFPNCADRFAKRVRAALEDAEDRDDWLALASLDDITMVAIGKVLGVSDESVRLACRSAEAKLRNLADVGGYSQDGDLSDLAEAILFGAGE